ncbi:hypothetical protein [Sporosarcina sp. E16_8]|uniref:hypothetical protein n=1 Tax=Sporosarcina sp. E16_8 TaxID=2789295 RepID=UPI001A930CA9|nr:hypothetical protein [Sporosarcina sp. E16_8]MBO0586471.1 hypothetical protein [Sporosarcina sp. E16_8]
MVTKTKNFYAYELEFTRIVKVKGKDEYQYFLDYESLKEIFMRCMVEDLADIKQNYGSNWFLAVEDVTEFQVGEKKEIYLAGRFVTGEYGRVGDLRNVDTMKTRKNNKKKREGEDKHVYFALRKKDGLLLLQGDVKVNRNRVSEYLNIIGENLMKRKNYFSLGISTLLKKDFIDEISAINVTSLEVEIAAEKDAGYENEIISAARKSAREFEANYVKIEWLAKYKRDKLGGLNQFVENIVPRGSIKPIKGINNIKVRGKDGDEFKTIYISKLSEKHELTMKFDDNNNALKDDTYSALSDLILKREILGRV